MHTLLYFPLQEMASPRLVKTHLSYEFVNRWVERDGVKTIVPLRNPKDTLVSMYHFYLMGVGKVPAMT